MSEMTKKAGKTSGVGKYVKEVKAELKKVTWPTFKQIRNNTLIVIAAIIRLGRGRTDQSEKIGKGGAEADSFLHVWLKVLDGM